MKVNVVVFNIDDILKALKRPVEDICIEVLDVGPWSPEEGGFTLSETKGLVVEHYLIGRLEEILGLSFYKGIQRSDVLRLPLDIENSYRRLPGKIEALIFDQLVIDPDMYNREHFLQVRGSLLIMHN